MKQKFPSIASVRAALVQEQRALRRYCSAEDLTDSESDFVGTDCRLRVLPGEGFQILTGSSDYDQDHRGFWGASSLSYGRQNLTDLARELLDQARDHYAQSVE